MTIHLKINGKEIRVVTVVNTRKQEYGYTLYRVDGNHIVRHKPADGAEMLASIALLNVEGGTK
jgi:hypothetical protein